MTDNTDSLPPMFEHQRRAVERYIHASKIPLFAEPGTGKTRMSLEIARAKYALPEEDGQRIDALLIITPNGIDAQWARQEVPKWYGPAVPADKAGNGTAGSGEWYSLYFCKRGRASKLAIPFIEGKLNVVIVNIDVFSTQAAYVRYVEWANARRTMIVLDEATRIKNPTAKRTVRLLECFNDVTRRGRTIVSSVPRTVARCLLTGTPVTNGVMDLWAMFEFLEPAYFSLNWYAFKAHYGLWTSLQVQGRTVQVPMTEKVFEAVRDMSAELAALRFNVSPATVAYIKANPVWKGPYRNVDQLIDRIKVDATFIRIRDVQDMPKQFYNVKDIEMGPEQAKAYKDMSLRFIASCTAPDGNEVVVRALTKVTALIRLQQIASGFIPLQDTTDDEPDIVNDLYGLSDMYDVRTAQWFPKVPRIDQLLADVEEMDVRESPLIIITHFSAEASRIYDELVALGHRVCLLTGFRKVGDVSRLGEDYDIVVANIRCIGMGYNLQMCHQMVFYSNTYSAEDRVQVEARIWRTGQAHTCIYTDYACHGTVDYKVLDALRAKKSIASYISDKSVRDVFSYAEEG